MNDPQLREGADPSEGRGAPPLLFLLFFSSLFAWGVSYLWFEGGHDLAFAGDQRSPPTVAAAAGPIDGAQAFTTHCAACHQATGVGVPGAFPPLAGSRWVTGDPQTPIRVVLRGLAGPIEVQGQTYQGAMPGLARLSDAEIAAIVTHARASWGNAASAVTADDVAAVRKSPSGQGGAIGGGAELERLR